MTFKFIELVVIVGALWFLWRSASRVGAQAAEQKAHEAQSKPDKGGGKDPNA